MLTLGRYGHAQAHPGMVGMNAMAMDPYYMMQQQQQQQQQQYGMPGAAGGYEHMQVCVVFRPFLSFL